jgi:hypothetical protein
VPAFPPLDQLQFLVGEVLTQIVLDPYQLRFRFESGRCIVVEGGLEHTLDGRTDICAKESRNLPPLRLHRLLESRILAVTVEPYRLSLVFERGGALVIRSDDGPYENGQICEADLRDGMIIF